MFWGYIIIMWVCILYGPVYTNMWILQPFNSKTYIVENIFVQSLFNQEVIHKLDQFAEAAWEERGWYFKW